MDTAKSKYKESDIFTNTKSESLLRFFYDGLTYSQELKPEKIIAGLMSFRDELTKEFEQLCSVQLKDKCISHPQAQALKEKKLKEKDENSFVLIFISFTIVILIIIVAHNL